MRDKSLAYFDENFSAFRLFVLSLNTKFHYHHKHLIKEVYSRDDIPQLATVFLDVDDLHNLYADLDELRDICRVAEDTYDEDNEDYNKELGQLKEQFENLNIEWLQEVISAGGSLYEIVTFNIEESTHSILEQEFSMEAYDEYLDEYVDKAMDMTEEAYLALQDAFDDDATAFLVEIEKILSFLDFVMSFTDRWKAARINPDIDNT